MRFDEFKSSLVIGRCNLTSAGVPNLSFLFGDELDTNAMPLRSTDEFQFRVTEQDHFR